MTFVGILGILISLLAFPFALRRPERARVVVCAGLLLTHFATTLFYYYWQQTNTSDAPLYYYDYWGFYGGLTFKLNTVFVIYFVQTLKSIIGGTYLDYFFLFQAAGSWAIVFLMRIFEEIYEDLGLDQPLWVYLLLFLPSLHFWTSAIGKDGPLALGSAMTAWAALRITQRYPIFLSGAGIMLFFRPHIALVAMASLALALIVDRRTKRLVRLALVALVAVALTVVALSVRSTFSVDVTSADSIADFFSSQAEIAKQFDQGTSVLNASYPVRLLSLLFRPLFIDAGGALGLLASFENLLVIGIIFTIFSNFSEFKRAFMQVLFVRYATIFSVAIILLLAVVYYNVGLGLRQRTMMFPTFLSLFIAICALRLRSSRVAGPARPRPQSA